MQVRIETKNEQAVVSVSGRIGVDTVPMLQDSLNELDPSTEKLVFDFEEVEYISSAGLRVLLSARKRMGDGRMKIVHVREDVYEIFVTTGFDSILEIEKFQAEESIHIDISFKQLLAETAAAQPDRAGLFYRGEYYTYQEFEQCAQIIAYDLSRQGVKKGTHVGLCSANSANWILTFFAIQKLGAIACLLNFNYNESEIQAVSKVGDITHLCYGEITTMTDEKAFLNAVTDETKSSITEVYDIRSTIDFKNRIAEYENIKGLFENRVEADDTCIMIFTSGSTGVPKGVLLSAYNVLNASASMAETVHIHSEDKLCLILPLFHIFGMTAGFISNLLHHAMIYIPENLRTDTLLKVIEEEKCTLFHSVPTMVLAIMNNKAFQSESVESLRCIILAGAPTTDAQIVKMRESFPNAHFVCSYGLSEMAPVSITEYEDSLAHISKTVGKAVDYIQLKIQNMESGEDCKTGEEGEILVEGYNLMCCYYKAALDSQAIDENGWLHTGDLGYLDEEGYLHLTGRAKELIIRGGENIMPNEVAEAISMESSVADVKVVGVPDDFFGEVVCACVMMKDGAEFDEEYFKAFLKGKLAKYKIPTYFLLYEAFPMLSNGKIDMVNLKKDAIARTKK